MPNAEPLQDENAGFDTLIVSMNDMTSGLSQLTDLLDKLMPSKDGGDEDSSGKKAKKEQNAMTKGFLSLGLQFKMISMILRPIGEIVGAIFKPFEAIFKVFGAFGSILSLAFLPTIMRIVDFLTTGLDPLLEFVTLYLEPFVTSFLDLIFGFSFLEDIIKDINATLAIDSEVTFGELFIGSLISAIENKTQLIVDAMMPIIKGIVNSFGDSISETLYLNLQAPLEAFVNSKWNWGPSFNDIFG